MYRHPRASGTDHAACAIHPGRRQQEHDAYEKKSTMPHPADSRWSELHTESTALAGAAVLRHP